MAFGYSKDVSNTEPYRISSSSHARATAPSRVPCSRRFSVEKVVCIAVMVMETLSHVKDNIAPWFNLLERKPWTFWDGYSTAMV